MVLKYSRLFRVLICSTLFGTLLPNLVGSQTVGSREEIVSVLAIENLSVREDVVTGDVLNRSPRLVRDVQLFIRYTWL